MPASHAIVVRVDLRWPAPEVPREQLEMLVRSVLAAEGYSSGCLDLSVVGDDEIALLNHRYLDRAGPTDVLSFDLGTRPPPVGVVDGEVILNGQQACLEASRRRILPSQELLLYAVHGLLHILGYDDRDPPTRAAMWARQRALLRWTDYVGPNLALMRR